MTKTVLDAALDAAFEFIASRGDLLTLCAGAPTSYFEATTLTTSSGRMVEVSARSGQSRRSIPLPTIWSRKSSSDRVRSRYPRASTMSSNTLQSVVLPVPWAPFRPTSKVSPRASTWAHSQAASGSVTSPREPSLPSSVVTSPASQRSDLTKAIYANSITLTPGTVSLEIDEDGILVHALTRADAAAVNDGAMDRRAAGLEGKD